MLAFLSGQAQDPVFTQFYAQKLYLNPAFAGYEPGLVVNTGFRSQWHQVANGDAQYLTNHIEVSQEFPAYQVGLGFSYTDNSEGEGIYRPTAPNTGLLRWQRYNFSFAWHDWACEIDDRRFGMALGFSGAYNRNVLNWERFRFGDQLDPIYGVVRPTALPIPDTDVSQNEFFDLSAGAIFHYIPNPFRSYRMGVAFHHIMLQNNSVTNRDNRLPMRISLHGSGVMFRYKEGSLQDQWQFSPGFRLDLQRASSLVGRPDSAARPFMHAVITAGGIVKTPGLTRLNAGIWYQGNMPLTALPRYRGGIHSVVLYGGLEWIVEARSGYAGQLYKLGFSWDHNFGGARSLGDVFELAFTASLPGVSFFGADCGSCMLRHVMRRF